MSWNDDEVHLLKRLFYEGRSASQIALEIGGGTKRNAVCGKLYRLGLKKSKLRAKMLKAEKLKETAPKGLLSEQSGSKVTEMTKHREKPLLPEQKAAPETKLVTGPKAEAIREAVSTMELKDLSCRWPLGDPGNLDTFRYCGAPARRGPYCGEHGRLAYKPKAK